MSEKKAINDYPASTDRTKESSKSGEVEVNKTRRDLLITIVLGGAAYVGWRFGFKRFFGSIRQGSQDATPNTEPEAKSEISQASEINTAEPYEKWSRNIELPTISFDPKAPQLTDKQLRDLLLPEYVDPEKLDDFFKKFDEMLLKIDSRFLMDRIAHLTFLQTNLAEEYKKLLKPSCSGECLKEIEERVDNEINCVLLMHGYWCAPDLKNKNFGPRLYKVKNASPLTFHHSGKSDVIPFIIIEETEKFSVRPERGFTPSWTGAILDKGNYILVDEYELKFNNGYESLVKKLKQLSGEKPPSETDFSAGSLNLLTHHEGMHAFCIRTFGLNPKMTPLKLSESINMGKYTLNLRNWGPISEIEINELAGHGFGLMHSGAAVHGEATTLILNDVTPGYKLAQKVLMDEVEVISTSHFPKHLYSKDIYSNPKIQDQVWKIILSLSAEELYRIGERMAKLAIFFAQRMGSASSKKL